MRARLAILLGCTVALGGCAYGYGGYGPYGGMSVGVGYGSGYGGYGYGGYGGCYDPYSAAGGYGGYDYYGFPTGGYGYGSCGGYGYGAPYYGWYGDYYYPGTGSYVYDRYRRPHVWNNTQQRYWTHQRERALSTSRTHDRQATQQTVRENWSGFNRPNRTDSSRRDNNRRDDDRGNRRSDSVRPQ